MDTVFREWRQGGAEAGETQTETDGRHRFRFRPHLLPLPLPPPLPLLPSRIRRRRRLPRIKPWHGRLRLPLPFALVVCGRRADVDVDAERGRRTRRKQLGAPRYRRRQLLVPVRPKILVIHDRHLSVLRIVLPLSSSSTHASSLSSSGASASTEMSGGSGTRMGHGVANSIEVDVGVWRMQTRRRKGRKGTAPSRDCASSPELDADDFPPTVDVRTDTGAGGDDTLRTMGGIPGGVCGRRRRGRVPARATGKATACVECVRARCRRWRHTAAAAHKWCRPSRRTRGAGGRLLLRRQVRVRGRGREVVGVERIRVRWERERGGADWVPRAWSCVGESGWRLGERATGGGGEAGHEDCGGARQFKAQPVEIALLEIDAPGGERGRGIVPTSELNRLGVLRALLILEKALLGLCGVRGHRLGGGGALSRLSKVLYLPVGVAAYVHVFLALLRMSEGWKARKRSSQYFN
ncbi:hypothetical protein B0H14DRAFT_3169111 [Mycena olivaceomarginata]|nr:hypothetical protein B0H14DRAFT_3169111 [Mycena olivaceomarginata]